MGKEELARFHAHKPIQAISFACGVVTEAGGSELVPLAVSGPGPLIAIKRFAAKLTVGPAEVFTEAVQSA